MFHDVLFNERPAFIFHDFIFYSKVALWPISYATKMLAVKMLVVTVLEMTGLMDEQRPRQGQSESCYQMDMAVLGRLCSFVCS